MRRKRTAEKYFENGDILVTFVFYHWDTNKKGGIHYVNIANG